MSQSQNEMLTGSSDNLPASEINSTHQPAAEKPITDLSPRVVQLARVIDRLPPGTFEVVLVKGEVKAMDWKVEIIDPVEQKPIQSLTISKYHPE